VTDIATETPLSARSETHIILHFQCLAGNAENEEYEEDHD